MSPFLPYYTGPPASPYYYPAPGPSPLPHRHYDYHYYYPPAALVGAAVVPPELDTPREAGR